MSGITKTNKFKILKNKFDSLIISSKKDKDNYLKYAADVNKYIHESKKRLNPDIIIDFNVENREEVYREIYDEVQNKYKDYKIEITLDVDISD